jgi:D-alanyl-D-alanine dipeptidase
MWLIRSCFILLVTFLFSCDRGRIHLPPKYIEESFQDDTLSIRAHTQSFSEMQDSLYALKGFVDVGSVNPAIRVELKYATTDNFLSQKVYKRIGRAYLKKDVAERLGRCQTYLNSIDTGLHLLIYDALRPVSVQRRMWLALDSIPPDRRGAYVSNPINRSLHNYGAAIDVTICRSDGTPLDMGAGFDDFREIAYPSREMYFFSKGELTDVHLNNRKLLRKVMRKEGFRNLPTEWWHFNACSRADASKLYKALPEEL